jgi:hypothetical protein
MDYYSADEITTDEKKTNMLHSGKLPNATQLTVSECR